MTSSPRAIWNPKRHPSRIAAHLILLSLLVTSLSAGRTIPGNVVAEEEFIQPKIPNHETRDIDKLWKQLPGFLPMATYFNSPQRLRVGGPTPHPQLQPQSASQRALATFQQMSHYSQRLSHQPTGEHLGASYELSSTAAARSAAHSRPSVQRPCTSSVRRAAIQPERPTNTDSQDSAGDTNGDINTVHIDDPASSVQSSTLPSSPPAASSMTWHVCGGGSPGSPMLAPESVTLAPDPPHHGRTMAVNVTGTSPVSTSGGRLAVAVAYLGFKVYTYESALCDAITCPLEAGAPFLLRVSQKLPALAPPGPYQMEITGVDEGGARFMCVAIDFRVTLPGRPEAPEERREH